jgi:hypothetical protein
LEDIVDVMLDQWTVNGSGLSDENVLELSRYPLEVCMNIGFDLENKLPR